MDLADWTMAYVRARNAVARTLVRHERNGDELTFTHTGKVHHYLISPRLRVPRARDRYTVVCLNTEVNLSFLLAHWEEFLQDGLTVLFANPNESASWQVNPKVHARIADPEALAQGLRALFSEVPPVS